MKKNQIIGFIVLTVGVIVLGFAYHATNSPMEKLSDAVSGSYSNQTMWFFAVGLAAAIGGGLFALFGKKTRRN